MTANMKQELYRVKSHVNKVKKADSIVIPFITDTHAGINNRNLGFLKKTGYDHMQSVVNLTKILECDYVVHGGDIIDGSSITVGIIKERSKGIQMLMTSKTCQVLSPFQI